MFIVPLSAIRWFQLPPNITDSSRVLPIGEIKYVSSLQGLVIIPMKKNDKGHKMKIPKISKVAGNNITCYIPQLRPPLSLRILMDDFYQ